MTTLIFFIFYDIPLYLILNFNFRALIRFTRVNYYLLKWERRNMTLPKVFVDIVAKHPHKVAFYFEDDIWSFQRVDEYSNRVANFFLSEGYQRGDCVALLLESRPEYICLWLGLSKIGVKAALINTNLTGDSLVHSIEVAGSKAVVFGSDFKNALKDIQPKIVNLKKYQFNENIWLSPPLFDDAKDLRTCLKEAAMDAVTEHIAKGNLKDHILYIYTSGTTGLPKAAVITNVRYMVMAVGLNKMVAVQNNDCIYDSLPLYHTAGGIVGTGQALLCGGTVAIRKKFSATNFWKDCVKYRCTIAQYIGETCRYLLAADDKNVVKHNVRAMFGNGLKAQIWKPFAEKFGIKEIFEFYGATESNSNLVNIDSTVGAVGFVPFYARFLYPVSLVQCDEVTGEPLRDVNGRYITCGENEPGVLIGKISTLRAVNQFTGYADKVATEKKILRDVFNEGDMYFNTGDILMYDDFGYFYFKDRTGDTFRWKGENVSTSEIEAVISDIAHLSDAVVYGVEVPGAEGKAGMAAIVDQTRSLDLEQFAEGLRKHLPVYAQPIFIRLMDSVELTGTFKLIKRDLVVEGFNIDIVKDDIFFYDVKTKRFVPLTRELYELIMKGEVRL
ncbi:long-chain fatty acid transport protein [Holotrichia oblita]|uniref:Long-chain fatty acid transport protein n=1 Tax=Holotrichia oblita TaxID=644536 RepID=A0ACB9TJY9_HOLOL|nr:long-chain fatty acid transport protein [Holotrichia oblita]